MKLTKRKPTKKYNNLKFYCSKCKNEFDFNGDIKKELIVSFYFTSKEGDAMCRLFVSFMCDKCGCNTSAHISGANTNKMRKLAKKLKIYTKA